jgi:hypothetical protein
VMSPPRYRTLDGDELELPLAMGAWVLVPRSLARFDPELAWALDYDDAPEPEDADPRLDFSAGALLVPVERWDEHAALEPNLAPYGDDASRTSPTGAEPSAGCTAGPGRTGAPRRCGVAHVAGRVVSWVIASMAAAYVVAVAVWLWSLRGGISGPAVSTGLVLVGAAVLLAWLAGVSGTAWRPAPTAYRRTVPGLGAAVGRLADHPLGILRLGLAVQLCGFVLVVAVR